MRTRTLGTTGFVVSEIGLGAGPLGGSDLDDAAAVRLIAGALDLGVTLVDTAPSYGRSEIRVGRALRGKRDRVVLSTKLGYGVPGVPDWTGPCILGGVDAALARMETDRIDVAHLHSCPLDVLARGEVVDALAACVRAGKVRVAAYSGDGEALDWAIASGRFGVVQCSVSIADQRALDGAVPAATARGIGVLAKRPLANAAWRDPERPVAPDRAIYWDRLRAMALPPPDVDAFDYALRFALAQPVSSVLVGTTKLAHLEAAIDREPLDDRDARARFDRSWPGVI